MSPNSKTNLLKFSLHTISLFPSLLSDPPLSPSCTLHIYITMISVSPPMSTINKFDTRKIITSLISKILKKVL